MFLLLLLMIISTVLTEVPAAGAGFVPRMVMSINSKHSKCWTAIIAEEQPHEW